MITSLLFSCKHDNVLPLLWEMEAIKIEKIWNEWNFPFQGEGVCQNYFHFFTIRLMKNIIKFRPEMQRRFKKICPYFHSFFLCDGFTNTNYHVSNVRQ